MFSKAAKKKKDVLDHQYISGLTAQEREAEYRSAVEAKWQELKEIFEDDSNWKLDKGTDLSTGMVYSKHFKNTGRISKLMCHIEMSPESLAELLVRQTESSPSWDPSIVESTILQRYDENCDVHYLVTREMAGGVVARRDYVNIRLLKDAGGKIVSVGCAASHPDRPVTKKAVRGKSKAMGMCFTPVPNEHEKCHLQWVMNIDIGNVARFMFVTFTRR